MDCELARKLPSRRRYQYVNSSSLLHGSITNSADVKSFKSNLTVPIIASSTNCNVDDNVFTTGNTHGKSMEGEESKHTKARAVISKRLVAKDRTNRRHTVGGVSKVSMDEIEKWIDENPQTAGKNHSKDDGEIYLARTNVVKTKMAQNHRNYVIRNNREAVKKGDTHDWKREGRSERNSCSNVSGNHNLGRQRPCDDYLELRLSNLLSQGINNRTNCFLSPRPFNKSSLQHYSVPWNRRSSNKMEKLNGKTQGLRYDLKSGEISPLSADEEIFGSNGVEDFNSKYSTFTDLSKLKFPDNDEIHSQTESAAIDNIYQTHPFTQSMNIDVSVAPLDKSAQEHGLAENNDGIDDNVAEQKTESQIRPATLKTCYISPPVEVKTPTLTPVSKGKFHFDNCAAEIVNEPSVLADKNPCPTTEPNPSIDLLSNTLNVPSQVTGNPQSEFGQAYIEKIASNLAAQICDEIANTKETNIVVNTEVSNNDSGIETEEVTDTKTESTTCIDASSGVVSDVSLEDNSISNKQGDVLPGESETDVAFAKLFSDKTDDVLSTNSEVGKLNIEVNYQSDKFIKTNAVKGDFNAHLLREKNIIKSGLKRLYQIAISTLESGCPGLSIKDVLNLFESKGILFSDPRLKKTFQRIEAEPKGAETTLDIDVFSRICEPSFKFVRSILLSQLTIPGFSVFKLRMSRIFERIKEKLNLQIEMSSNLDPFSNYNEMMKRKNSDKTGISLSICTVDGQRISFGESESPFPLNSCASVFNFYLACKLNGVPAVSSYLGKKPKPQNESEFNFDEQSRVWNPFTKAGTFLSACLIYRDVSVESRLSKLHEFYSDLIGEEPLCCDNLSYNYKRIYGHEEIGLAYYLSAVQKLPRNSSVDLTDLLDLMFQSTSTAMTADACAVAAATLANGGMCPLTGCVLASKEVTRHTLNVMRSSERVTSKFNRDTIQGIAINWSENGSLILVVPGVLGMSCFTHCQSHKVLESVVVELIEDLTKDFNFGVYRSLRERRDGLFPK